MYSFRISLDGGFDSRLTDVRNGSSVEAVAPYYVGLVRLPYWLSRPILKFIVPCARFRRAPVPCPGIWDWNCTAWPNLRTKAKAHFP